MQSTPQATWNKSSDPRENLGSQVQMMQKEHRIFQFSPPRWIQLGVPIWLKTFLPRQVTRAQKRDRGDTNYIYCGSNMKLTMNSSYGIPLWLSHQVAVLFEGCLQGQKAPQGDPIFFFSEITRVCRARNYTLNAKTEVTQYVKPTKLLGNLKVRLLSFA